MFVAYSDSRSASLALSALSRHWRSVGQRVALRPMLWAARQLAQAHWGQVALQDALHADCVLLALDKPLSGESPAELWLTRLSGATSGSALSVIVHAGEDELWNLSIVGGLGPDEPSLAASATEAVGSHSTRRARAAAA